MKKISSYFAAQDMTVGKPYAKILQFAIPMLLGNLAQQLYSTVDSIVVGKFVGDGALAAVGNSFPLTNLLLVLFVGISTGASIMISQYFGAGRRKELSDTLGTCITLTGAATLIIMITGPLITPFFVRLIKTPDDIFDMTCTYLFITFIGIAGSTYFNILSGIIRGLGDSFSSLLFLLIATVINIVLDLTFVAVFRWGVAGVAIATIISQIISAILCFIRLHNMRDILDMNRHTLRPNRKLSVQLCRLGIPSGISQAIFALSSVVVQSLTNSFGTTVIACCVVVMRVDGFAMMPNFSFGNAMTTYTGQNIGAGKIDRVTQGTRQGVLLSCGFAALLTTCILLFGRNLMALFTDTEELIVMGMHMMRIIAVGYIAVAVTQSLSGVLRGAGDTVSPMWIGFITTVAIRVPIAYLWAYFTRSEALPNGSPDSLYWSLLISWLIGALLTCIAYSRGKWKKSGIVNAPEGPQA